MRRYGVSKSVLDITAPTEWKAFVELVRPKFSSYLTPKDVERILELRDPSNVTNPDSEKIASPKKPG